MGEHHLDFLREFSEFHHGSPCARWLRDLVNRIDPALFAGCFNPCPGTEIREVGPDCRHPGGGAGWALSDRRNCPVGTATLLVRRD
jgi:hypothetical protein